MYTLKRCGYWIFQKAEPEADISYESEVSAQPEKVLKIVNQKEGEYRMMSIKAVGRI